MFFAFSVALTVFLAIYGTACYWLGTVMVRRAAGRGNMVLGFVLRMAALWFPCVLACVVVASMLPLAWGHGGEMILAASLIGGALVFAAMLMRFGAQVSSGAESQSTEVESDGARFRCGKCNAAIAPDASLCQACGFAFGR